MKASAALRQALDKFHTSEFVWSKNDKEIFKNEKFNCAMTAPEGVFAQDYLKKVLPADYLTVVSFNDAPSTKFSDIEKLYKDAIHLAESEGN